MNENNPFIYEAATNLSDKTIEDFYIDVEKSDLLTSQKIFLLKDIEALEKVCY